jgi:hypothetical protein
MVFSFVGLVLGPFRFTYVSAKANVHIYCCLLMPLWSLITRDDELILWVVLCACLIEFQTLTTKSNVKVLFCTVLPRYQGEHCLLAGYQSDREPQWWNGSLLTDKQNYLDKTLSLCHFAHCRSHVDRTLNYIMIQLVPRSKHTLSQLYKPVS